MQTISPDSVASPELQLQKAALQKTGRLRASLLLLLNIAAAGLLVSLAVQTMHTPLTFDDAFMFYRYAVHLRQGLGISWNLDGVHTGGMTSLGWFLAVIPLSLLPLGNGQALAMGSLAVGAASLAGLAFAIARLATHAALRRFWLVFPVLTLLLVLNASFRANMVTGMDTMLSFAADALLSCAVWAWCARADKTARWAVLVGVCGACAVMVRPENGLLAVLVPAIACVLLIDRQRRGEVVWIVSTMGAILMVYEGWYRSYFHAWLPLSFYMKAQHPYRGYTGGYKWSPAHYLVDFGVLAAPVLAYPLVCVQRRSLKVALAYLLPVALTFGYLGTVMQIMGTGARFYVPFAAPVVVAAVWMADLSLKRRVSRARLGRAAAGVAVLLPLAAVYYHLWWWRHPVVDAYAAPTLLTPAAGPLPLRPWFGMISALANEVVRPLPQGSVIAASEVGLVGAAAPHVDVIDLAGLNDNEIALGGFRMDRVLERKPLLIWFPHEDYTWQRQAMFCSPGLLANYTVLGGNAFNYSLAVRRDTAESALLLQRVDRVFQQMYPGASMRDYVVSSIACAGVQLE